MHPLAVKGRKTIIYKIGAEKMGFERVKSYSRCDICPLAEISGYDREIICHADTENNYHLLICAAHGLRTEGININAQIGFIVDILAPLRQLVDELKDEGISVRGSGIDGEFKVAIRKKEGI